MWVTLGLEGSKGPYPPITLCSLPVLIAGTSVLGHGILKQCLHFSPSWVTKAKFWLLILVDIYLNEKQGKEKTDGQWAQPTANFLCDLGPCSVVAGHPCNSLKLSKHWPLTFI